MVGDKALLGVLEITSQTKIEISQIGREKERGEGECPAEMCFFFVLLEILSIITENDFN